MNSWALLEKHLYHCHLHPSLPGPSAEHGSRCLWDGCNQTFATRKDCYQHCLTTHMSLYCARCPFSKSSFPCSIQERTWINLDLFVFAPFVLL